MFLYGWIILLIIYMFISIVICYKKMLFFRKTKWPGSKPWRQESKILETGDPKLLFYTYASKFKYLIIILTLFQFNSQIIITLNPVSDFSFTLRDKISVTAFVPEIQSLFINEESEMLILLQVQERWRTEFFLANKNL